jgi:hypothetical protein
MASPLAMRIVIKTDTASLDATNQKLRTLKGEMQTATITAKGSKEDIQRLADAVKKLGQEIPVSGKGMSGAFENLSESIKPLMSTFKTLRRELAFATIIATPFILAAKHVIDLNQQIIPLRTTIEQLGQASQAETTRFVGFIKTLTFGTTTSVREGIEALSTYIEMTKGTANAEGVLSAAQTLRIAKGIKLVEATKAITQALQGDTTALANLTLKTKEEISNLAKSGDLAKTIQSNFSNAADKAQSGVVNSFKRLVTTAWRFTMESTAFAHADRMFKAVEDATTARGGFKALKKSLNELASTKVSFNSIDDLRTQLGRVNQRLTETRTQLRSAFTLPQQKEALLKIFPQLKEYARSLEKQTQLQQQLASVDRNKLQTQSELLAGQNELFVEQNRSFKTINESNDSLEIQKQIRQENLDAELKLIEAESLSQRKQILAGNKGITPEEDRAITEQERQKKNNARAIAYKIDKEESLRVLDSDTKLNRARLELQKFYLQNKLKQYSGASWDQIQRVEGSFVNKEVAFAIEAAKREALEITKIRRLTSADIERIEKETLLKTTSIRKTQEESLDKATQERLGNLTEEEQFRVREIAQMWDKDPRSGGWTAQREMEGFKKQADERAETADRDAKAVTKWFGPDVTRQEAEKTGPSAELAGFLQAQAKTQIVPIVNTFKEEIAKINGVWKEALTPDEKTVKDSAEKFGATLQETFNGMNVKIPVGIRATDVDMDALVNAFNATLQQKLSGASAVAYVGQGAEQGGSKS